MAWFKKSNRGLKTQEKKELPGGLWLKCGLCEEIIYRKEWEKNLFTCPRCDFHFPLSSWEYIAFLMDSGTFQETDRDLAPTDRLHFKDSKRYTDRLRSTQERTGLLDAAVSGIGAIGGVRAAVCLLDFRFIGGSMGSVVGEKIARTVSRAIKERLPLVILSSSGGARMQEGALSLMQMAKTSAILTRLADARLPFISILTHPTTGGVSASFASQGDVIIAEPKALIGFAGPRVIEQTIGQELPEGFQRSEFLLEHGMVDMVVHRRELREVLERVLRFMTANGQAAG
jgi:acetyl-CoA carboxylase carboxyl transferase subunit beta